MCWRVTIGATVFGDEDGDGEDVPVGKAVIYIVPDAGRIDLFLTLDAVDQELANMAEMLTNERPDLVDELDMFDGGDLMYLSAIEIVPEYRGQQLGHTILTAIMETIGRSVGLVVLQAAPMLRDGGPREGTPEHDAAKAALARYWEGYGFIPTDRGYMVYGDVLDLSFEAVHDPFLTEPE